MQLICSPSGIGKTSIAMKEFKKHGILPPKPEGLKPSPRLLIGTRPINAIALVRVLFRCAQSQAAVSCCLMILARSHTTRTVWTC